MTSFHPIDVEKLLAEQLAQASPDLLRGLLSAFIHALMGAEADAICGAGCRQRSDERSNSRNGYRMFNLSGDGLCVGRRDSGSAVTADYTAPFPFVGGTIEGVVVDVTGDHYVDHEKEVLAYIARDWG